MLGNSSDEALVAKALAGKARAWEKLVSRYQAKIFNLCVRMVGEGEEALDVTQEVFLAVYRGLPRFRGDAKFSTWIHGIAMRRACDALRRRKDTETLEEEVHHLQANTDLPDDCLVRGEENRLVLELLGVLSADQKAVVELKFFQNQTFEEMAGVLNISANTAKTRFYAALRRLKKEMVGKPEWQHTLAGVS